MWYILWFLNITFRNITLLSNTLVCLLALIGSRSVSFLLCSISLRMRFRVGRASISLLQEDQSFCDPSFMAWFSFGLAFSLFQKLLLCELSAFAGTSYGQGIFKTLALPWLLGIMFVCLSRKEGWGFLTYKPETRVSWLSIYGISIKKPIPSRLNGFNITS